MIPFVPMDSSIVPLEVVTSKSIRVNQQADLTGVHDYLERLKGQSVWRNSNTNAEYMLRKQQQLQQQQLQQQQLQQQQLQQQQLQQQQLQQQQQSQEKHSRCLRRRL